MQKIFGSCWCALLCLLTALPVDAALHYTIETEIVREKNNKVKTEKIIEQIVVDGDKARIDFLEPDGSKSADGEYILTVNGGKTFIWSDGSRAYCADWSAEEFFSTIGQLLNKGARFIKAELAEAKVSKVLEEAGPEMLGYPTTHLQLQTSFGGKGRVLFKKVEYVAEQSDELWMTAEIEMPAHEKLWLEVSGSTGFAYLDTITADWDAIVTGAVLKHLNVMRLIDVKSGKGSRRTETMEVTGLETVASSDIPADTFAVPQCKQVSKKEREQEAKKFVKKALR